MDPVHPLRISKPNTSSSPLAEMSSDMAPKSRPLAEIGSTERRRNSPSYNQATRKMIVSHETSPYTENSPPSSGLKGIHRDFWHARDVMSPNRLEKRDALVRSSSFLSSNSTPRRRPSVERLTQVSPVRNSNIFALESKDTYDPATLPIVERPTTNRPLSQSVANSPFTRFDSIKKENNPYRIMQQAREKSSEEDLARSQLTDNAHALAEVRDSPSPTKSSLARVSMFDISPSTNIDFENRVCSDGDETGATPRSMHRHAKSVTFHAAPPVVNEYEEQTPEPSLSMISYREGSWESDEFDERDNSFERGSAGHDEDDSFDADLENVEKTPVVLPENWSRMTPEEARTDLVDAEDDVFQGENTEPSMLDRADRSHSDNEARPLPPLPHTSVSGHSEASILAIAAERAALSPRNRSYSRNRASCSKEDILNMTGQSSLTLEERLKKMNGRNAESNVNSSKRDDDAADDTELLVTKVDSGKRVEVRVGHTQAEQDSFVADLSELANEPPRISRESILRKVRNSKYDFEDESEDDASELINNAPARPPISELAKFHPDEPVPSRENSRDASSSYSTDAIAQNSEHGEVVIKEEPPDDDHVDMSAIPTAEIEPSRSPSRLNNYDGRAIVSEREVRLSTGSIDERVSRESSMAPDAEGTMIHYEQYDEDDADDGKETLQDAMSLLSVKDYSGAPMSQTPASGDFLGLPACYTSTDYDFGMKKYITPSPPTSPRLNQSKTLHQTAFPNLQPSSKPYEEESQARPSSSEHEVSPPGTPGSVVHNMDEQEPVSPLDEPSGFPAEIERQDSPAVPERQATIRTNGRFKTRKSGTQTDLLAVAEQRRLASEEHVAPPVLHEYSHEVEEFSEDSHGNPHTSAEIDSTSSFEGATNDRPSDEFKARRKSRKSGGRMDLALDTSAFSIGDSDGLGLDHDFDRVIEAQKRGYLMRQNTKLIVATNRNFSGESDQTSTTVESAAHAGGEEVRDLQEKKRSDKSPRKTSAEQYLKTEPWNGKMRRKSVRKSGPQRAAASSGPAPPLPGMQSAVGSVNEELNAGSLEHQVPEGFERGRLFVKVVGVNDLDLPLPKNDRLFFQLTLDNGLHCVTTADMQLGCTAAIGQEFELVVLNDLEFQLTLTTQLPAPAPVPTPKPSPTKAKAQKQSGFSRLLSSPKKRAEKERQEREAAEAEERRLQEEALRKRASAKPTAWDLLRELVNGQDGSFARAYVNLKGYEHACFGRQLTVDVPCYNEWALEKDSRVLNSVRSKRGNNTSPIRRPPYIIGRLQLQLLYVPKPKGAADTDLPKSMSSAIREISKATDVQEVVHESHLSQQGGDCTHWRRRFFRLEGGKLTAYHEHTHQKRAVINLSKAVRLVDDRSTLIADPTTSPSKSKKSRRKSAFAEEDEGYQYVEEGFRIRFANGETIDFYADSRADKEQWMQALSQVIGKPDVAARATRWTDLVLARERTTSTTAGNHNDSVVDKTSQVLQQNGTEVKDFSAQPPPQAVQSAPDPPAKSPNRLEKPLPPPTRFDPSKSVPSSPTKRAPVPRPHSSDGSSTSSSGARARGEATSTTTTPPLQPRRGHRTRDAVKSMIF